MPGSLRIPGRILWGVLLLAGAAGVLLFTDWGGKTTPPDSAPEYRRLAMAAPFVAGQRGGTLSFDVAAAGVSGFNPVLSQDQETGPLLQLLHAGLIEQDVASAALEPALAVGWQVQNDTDYTFTLRRGVRWSDGEPFGAQDVVFTFRDVVFNEEIPSPLRRLFTVDGRLPQVVALDDGHVRFTTPQPYAPFLRWLSFVPILPKHLLAQYVARLHPPGALQVWGRARVILQSTFRQRAHAYVGEEALQALERNLTLLKEALEAQTPDAIRQALDALFLALGVVEAGLPRLDQAQALPEDELYVVGLLGLGITNMRQALDQVRTQAQAGNFDGIGMRQDALSRAWTADEAPERLAGLGPFVVRAYNNGQLRLARNPHYWKQDAQGTVLPYLDEVRIHFVHDADEALADFGRSKTQLLFARAQDLPLLQGKTGVVANQARFSLALNAPSLAINFVVFNQDTPDKTLRRVFGDLAFRKAVNQALDRQRLIEEALGGAGLILDGPIEPHSRYHAEGLTQDRFDLAQAAATLEAAGYRDRDHDGRREDAAGAPLAFALTTNKDNPLRVRTAELLQEALGALGIEVSVKRVGFEQLLQQTLAGAYQAAVLGVSGGVDPYGGLQLWRLDGQLRFWRLHSAPPPWEQQAAQLFQAAAATLDEEQRRTLYVKFQRLVVEHLPLLFTVEPLLALAYDNALKNAAVPNVLGAPLRVVEFLSF